MRFSLIFLVVAVTCLGACSEAFILKHLAKKAVVAAKAIKAVKAVKAAKAVKAVKSLALPILGAKGLAKAAIFKHVAVKKGLAKAALYKTGFGHPRFYPIPVAPLIPIALAYPPPPPPLPVKEVVTVPKEPVFNVDEIVTAWDATSTAFSNHLGRFGHRVQSYIPFAGSVSVSAPAASVDIEVGNPLPPQEYAYPAPAPLL